MSPSIQFVPLRWPFDVFGFAIQTNSGKLISDFEVCPRRPPLSVRILLAWHNVEAVAIPLAAHASFQIPAPV